MSDRAGRGSLELRPVTLERGAAPNAEGSCLVAFGGTRVLCTATVEESVPRWRMGQKAGWVTAEYAMLPRATGRRTERERGGARGRTQEIQRLIGRSLRAAMDLEALGARTVIVDCDVLVADGGTRTAAITGGAVALRDACRWLVGEGKLSADPFRELVAAVSVGLVGSEVLVDLDYREDVAAEVDLNLVGMETGGLVEVQGTGERGVFSREQLGVMLDAGLQAIVRLFEDQRTTLEG